MYTTSWLNNISKSLNTIPIKHNLKYNHKRPIVLQSHTNQQQYEVATDTSRCTSAPTTYPSYIITYHTYYGIASTFCHCPLTLPLHLMTVQIHCERHVTVFSVHLSNRPSSRIDFQSSVDTAHYNCSRFSCLQASAIRSRVPASSGHLLPYSCDNVQEDVTTLKDAKYEAREIPSRKKRGLRAKRGPAQRGYCLAAGDRQTRPLGEAFMRNP